MPAACPRGAAAHRSGHGEPSYLEPAAARCGERQPHHGPATAKGGGQRGHEGATALNGLPAHSDVVLAASEEHAYFRAPVQLPPRGQKLSGRVTIPSTPPHSTAATKPKNLLIPDANLPRLGLNLPLASRWSACGDQVTEPLGIVALNRPSLQQFLRERETAPRPLSAPQDAPTVGRRLAAIRQAIVRQSRSALQGQRKGQRQPR